jgi:group I intron endonuclease
MSYFIYKITNTVNNKVYIGATARRVSYRWSVHKSYSRMGLKKLPLYNEMRFFGIECFTIETIQTCGSIDEMHSMESFYIAKFDSTNGNKGYNISKGGAGGSTGITLSTERKSEISKRMIGVHSKMVVKCDLNGIEIKTYNSFADAERETKVPQPAISNAVSGRFKTGGGFIWKLKK